MKKNTLFIILLLCSILSFSQSFNYQAVVRNSTGDIVANQSVGARVRLLQGSATGTTIYTEIHTITTNNQGILSLSIGTGTTEDVFTNIDWSTQNYWLEIAVDITGGTTYTIIGASQLLSVPYANYATSGILVKQPDPNGGGIAISNVRTGVTPPDEDFIFGSAQVEDDDSIIEDNGRMFFNKSRASFRAGLVENDQWNYDRQGDYSVAFGNNTVASAESSFAMGRNTQANGLSSGAMGIGVIAESYGEFALGYFNTNPGTGSIDEAISTDRLFVLGNGSSATRSDALVMLKNGNTTLNGQLTIDGDNQGSGTSYTLPAQDGSANQIMTTDGSGNVSWVNTPISTGVFSTVTNVTSNAPGDITTDDFVFGSSQLNNDPNTLNDNAKFFFDKSKAAFRVGRLRDIDLVDPEDNEPGDQWDDANVGEESIALGNSTAAGNNSIAIGNFNNLNSSANESVAIGRANNITAGGSFAFGSGNTIDHGGSTAIGLANTSSGLGATAIGFVTHAGSYSEIAIGLNNTVVNGTKDTYVASDRLFVIGNGISVLQRRDALVMLKNGNTTLNGSLTIDGDNTGVGASYTLPAQDGTANQVMATDGSGNVSWMDIPAPTVAAYTSATLNTAEGWEDYNTAFGVTSFQDPRYRINDNMVYLEGMVRKNTSISNSDTILTLPVGYRPQKTRIFSVQTENGTIRVDVNPNGTILVATGFNVNQNWVSLDGITFSVD